MKYLFSLTVLLFSSLLLSGCLVFHSMSYTIDLENNQKGKATVVFRDIMSSSKDTSEFNTDKNNLFQYAWKSEDFIKQMADEGKTITSRDLYQNGDTLMGKVTFNFNDLSKVENISYESGFYYLTLTPEDSVLHTNGTIIRSKKFTRILWDNSMKTLQFEMLGFEKRVPELTSLSPYLKQYK
jgi:hypothetical protein